MRDLLKAIVKTGSGSLATVLFGMATVKLIAWHLGPEALGSFSLTRQIVLAGSALFITGGQTALVQGISSRVGKDRDEFTSTCFILLSGGSLALGAIFFLLNAVIGRVLFPGLGAAIPIAAIAIATSGPMASVFGALNATKRIGRLAIAQALNAAALAAAVSLMLPVLRSDRPIWFAVVLAASQFPGLLLGAFFLWRDHSLRLSLQLSSAAATKFAKFAFATVTAAALQSWTVLGIRSSVATHLGLGSAGVFDAGWSISMVYVMLILGSFSTYYLPTLASANTSSSRLMNDVLHTTLLLVVPLIALVMGLRPLVLVVLYSREFLTASSMMHWMLIGDFFKVLSFVLAVPMLARADLRAFLAGEIGWNLVMLIGSRIALSRGLGIEALGIVFAVSYAAYFIYALVYCARVLRWYWPRDLVVELLSALVVLAIVSKVTWSVRELTWTPTVGCFLAAIAQVVLVLRRRSETESRPALLAEAKA